MQADGESRPSDETVARTEKGETDEGQSTTQTSKMPWGPGSSSLAEGGTDVKKKAASCCTKAERDAEREHILVTS